MNTDPATSIDAFAGPGEWLRCQLHAHTTNSDGTPTPAELVDHYADAGFDVLAITDHWFATDHPSERLLVIASSELSARHGVDHEAEVLALGVATVPQPREEFESIAACAEWIDAHGGVPFLAHPYWSGLQAEDYLSAPALAGLEVFNGGCELESGDGAARELWDAVLRSGRPCLGIATDDCHRPGRDSLQGWTMVHARERTREAVLEALRSGRFYASAGPAIEAIELADGALRVRCSPARAVTLRSAPWSGGRANSDPGLSGWRGEVLERDRDGWIVSALLQCPERANWGRLEIVAPDGRLAWTNPIALPNAPGGAESNWEE